MNIKNYKILLVVGLGLLLVSCMSTAITPIKVKTDSGSVVIEVNKYRITEKITSELKTGSYLVYGIAGLPDCSAVLRVMPYDKAKQLIKQYGKIGSCKSASGQEWMGSSYDMKCYASDNNVENSIKKINRLRTVSVIKINYVELKLLELVKKEGAREIKYKQVIDNTPHYLITSMEIIDEKFSLNDL